MSDLTPETLAELRRLYEAAFTVGAPENDWEEWTRKAAEAFPALLDAAAERDRLARLLDEPRRSGCAVEIAGVRIAPCDKRGQTADMLAADRLRRELAATVERVRALADEWTYNGGWDDGSHAYGTDCVVQALDYAAAKLRRALDEEPQP